MLCTVKHEKHGPTKTYPGFAADEHTYEADIDVVLGAMLGDMVKLVKHDKHQVTQGLQDVTCMRKMRRHFPLSRCVRLGLLDACLPSPASRMRRGARHEAAACRKSPRRTNVAREGLAVVGSGS